MKTKSTECPEPNYLKQFLLGNLTVPEIEECQQHLSDCDPCVETVEGLKVEDTFTNLTRQAWLDSAAEQPDKTACDSKIVENIVRKVRNWDQGTESSAELKLESVSLDRAAEVQRLLGAPVKSEDIGKLKHYRIIKLLGSGSTGVVYLADDTQLCRSAVLKILRPSLGDAARQRFIAEARATAAIDHANVVTIYEVGSDGPLAYIAMQWMPGQTLDQKLAEQETLALDDVRQTAIQIASGLSAAHENGLIHRDIKPANIWIPDGRDEAKILDFGLVRITDEDPQLTCTGLIAGTPCYMSPEQSRGDQLDHRSDLFSLGCLMYQSLTGKLPFRSDNALATLRSIQQDQPTALSELDPSIPDDVSDLVMCLLEKSPSRRPPNAEAAITALQTERENWGFEVPETHVAGREAMPHRRTRFSIWKTIAALTAGILLGTGGWMYGQQIIRVVTNHGEIVIDTRVEDVKIEVVENGEVVRIIDLATQQSIEIKAGQYEIRPVSGDNSIAVNRNVFTLTRGGQEIVSVRRIQHVANNDLAEETDPAVPYRFRRGDILGVFIDGVLGQFDDGPPIHVPSPESGLPPAVGFPVLVEHDGKIVLPYIPPVEAIGKTIGELRDEIDAAFKEGDNPMLREQARIIVNLMRKRDWSLAFNRNRNTRRDKIGRPDSVERVSQLTDPSSPHRLGSGDVVGLFIEGVLGSIDSNPPVHYPPAESGLPPAVGFPVLVEHNGKIAIPNIPPLVVSGKTIGELRRDISIAFKKGDDPILREGARIIVNLIRKRDFAKNTYVEEIELPLEESDPEDLTPGTTNVPELGGPVKFRVDESSSRTVLIGDAEDIRKISELMAEINQESKKMERAVDNQATKKLPDLPVDPYNEKLSNLEKDYAKQQLLFDRNEIDRFTLLESEAQLLGHKHKDYSTRPDDQYKQKRRLLDVRTEQFELTFTKLDDEPDNQTKNEIAATLNEIRKNLSVSRIDLAQYERANQLTQSQSVYDGETYDELLLVVKTERDLAKINPAITGIANLASRDWEKDELLEAIIQVARRQGDLASVKDTATFDELLLKVLGSLNLATMTDVFINELEHGTQESRRRFLTRRSGSKGVPFTYSIMRKANRDPRMAQTYVMRITDSLEKYSTTKTKLEDAYHALCLFEDNWGQWGLRNNTSTQKIFERYFEDVLDMKMTSDNSLEKMAQLMPATKGLSELIATELRNSRTELSEKMSLGQETEKIIAHVGHALRIYRELDDNPQLEKQLIDWANAELEAFMRIAMGSNLLNFQYKGRVSKDLLKIFLHEFECDNRNTFNTFIQAAKDNKKATLVQEDGKVVICVEDAIPSDDETDIDQP